MGNVLRNEEKSCRLVRVLDLKRSDDHGSAEMGGFLPLNQEPAADNRSPDCRFFQQPAANVTGDQNCASLASEKTIQ
jgi:hypothetical protein